MNELEIVYEVNFMIWQRISLNKTRISWEYLRKYCKDDETTDLLCAFLSKNYGFEITFKGALMIYIK
jgi:hypothetical protein